MHPADPSDGGLSSNDSRVFQQLVRMVAGDRQPPALVRSRVILLPLVRRTIQTGHGPPALIHWLGRAIASHEPIESAERLAWELTEELLASLLGPPDPWADTVC